MSPKSPDTLPEIFVATAANSHQIRRMRLAGLVRKLRPRIFTRNLQDPPEDIIKRNLWHLTGELLPGAVVSHRTALELKPVQDTIFVTDDVGGKLVLPGLTIIRTKGPGPLDGDRPFMNGLFLASRPRAFLENLQDSRSRAFLSKGLKRAEFESRLSRIAREDPANGLNIIRDEARRIAPLLSAEREFEILDGIIGAMQGTREAALQTREAIALRDAKGFDPHRIALFSELHARLYDGGFAARPDTGGDEAFRNVAFFDAYFSNYIEGTEFEIDEAISIVFDRKIPERRPADAHDVDGTFGVVGSRANMNRLSPSFDGFIALLKERHRQMMHARPEILPGTFKTATNKAGSTVFVAPHLVEGTLAEGWKLLQTLDHPFARALFVMFITAEVHPFNDGNGRIARAMMNSELTAKRSCRIFIPSVYRNEYIASLKRLTNHKDPDSFIRVMDFAQELVSQIDFSNLDHARDILTKCNAFMDPTDDQRLLLPLPTRFP
jgi:fido (protein-threonine AMPylation protein)